MAEDGTVYIGWRDQNGTHVRRIRQGKVTQLPPRADLRNHSPTGFEWGYGGSGPAQLALALASDVLARDRNALEVYQHLKRLLVITLPYHCWSLSEYDLRHFITRILAEGEDRSVFGGWRRELITWADDPRASTSMRAP